MYAQISLVHIAEHAVIEGIVHLLHLVTDAGSKSIIYGDQAAAHYALLAHVPSLCHDVRIRQGMERQRHYVSNSK